MPARVVDSLNVMLGLMSTGLERLWKIQSRALNSLVSLTSTHSPAAARRTSGSGRGPTVGLQSGSSVASQAT